MNEKQIDYIIGLIVDGYEAEAVFKLLTLRRAIVQSAQPHPDDRESLPNLRPFKPKRPKSINVSCPTCGAKAGKPCFEMTNAGRNATPTDVVRANGYHAKRVAKAKGQS